MIRIDRASAGDAPEIAALYDAYRQFFTAKEDVAASQRFLSERLGSGESVVFVARTDGIACGFVQLYPLWSSWYCARIWFLSDLYVSENVRRHGIGRRLIERVKAFAGETHASSVMVELPLREPHLRDFYARLGFHEDDVFTLARYRPEL
jgi:GNAT superfamily N-acetyltransferase